MIYLACFKALADETRLRLFNILLHHELSVNEIVTLMDMGQSRISRHLKILTDAGLVSCRRDGAWAFYSAVSDGMTGKLNTFFRTVFVSDPLLSKDIETAAALMQRRSRQSRNFFNAVAGQWNALQQGILGEVDLNGEIVTAVDRQANHLQLAVDLGCGSGRLLAGLAARVKAVVGIDSSRKMLDQAEAFLSRNHLAAELRLGELEHLPMGDNEADLAVISMVLHHLQHPEKAVLEAARILRPGGLLVIAEFDKHKNEALREHFKDRRLGFSVEEIRDICHQAGFALLDTRAIPLQSSIHLHIITARKPS